MRLLIAAALVFFASTPAAAMTLHQYSDIALSAAGDRVAAVESDTEPNAPRLPAERIVIRNARTGAMLATVDQCAGCRYYTPSFIPDGRLLAIVRDGSKARLILVSPNGHAATLSEFEGIAQKPLLSPDGRSVAVLATLAARKEAGATQAGVRQVGEIGETNDEQRIAVVALAGGPLRPISPSDRYVYEYDWLPDGSGFVATSARGNGDNNWWVATLDRIDRASGSLSAIAAPAMELNFPRVSPDGRTVAFIGGLMSDFGPVGGDIYTVPVTGGTPTDVTPGYRGTFTSLVWDRNGLVASAVIGDRMAILPIVAGRGPGSPLWSAPVTIKGGDARFARSRDGRIYAAEVEDFERPPSIYAGPLARFSAVTHDNDNWPSLVRAQSVTWRNEGFDVQGWLVAPRTAPSAGKAPLVVTVHGGPSSAASPSFIWEAYRADLARAGYYQFFPNPRGSYGQGEAFTRANIRDFGGGDLRDILTGIDAVEKVAPVDDNRLGLIGHSYGGFMAMWTNTQTNRFKAIVAGAGLSDWISYYGTNGIDQWMIPFFGQSVYDDPAPYWAVSAIRTIKQARTPTFIYVGERDIEVPPTQSIEYWHALQAMKVPTSLVIYPDEGHGIRAPEHDLDLRRRTVEWFDRYLGSPRSNTGH
ncbi:S9 family peptidase [Sphingomonas sp.]|uniref:S9 family peptidase n=1 Tax=Sphingomonas sp. TaxID=28214 RepID=UPI0038AED644